MLTVAFPPKRMSALSDPSALTFQTFAHRSERRCNMKDYTWLLALVWVIGVAGVLVLISG